MIINNLNLVGVRSLPSEADPPLIIDPDAVLPRSSAFQRFQSVARWHGHVPNGCGGMQLEQFTSRCPLNLCRKPPGDASVENLYCLRTGEALNHFHGT